MNIYNKFLTHKECNTFLDYAICNFEIDSRTYSGWHARTNKNTKFESIIFNKLKNISPHTPFQITWINLTEYENGRELLLHYDERSKYTFTILLTDNYIGGDFIIEDNIYKLNKGDCISFNGNTLLHGVTPVTNGYRAALNIWIKSGTKNIL